MLSSRDTVRYTKIICDLCIHITSRTVNSEIKQYNIKMAEQKQEEHRRVGLIAMDGSEHSDYAFHCKYNFYFHF